MEKGLKSEFEIPDYFFGKGSNPIVTEDALILNVGGKNNECVVAFNLLTGETKWIVKDSWGASYSSPVNAIIHERNVCLIFTGGESRPPHGGLLVIDARSGQKLSLSNGGLLLMSLQIRFHQYPFLEIGFSEECYEKGVMISIDAKKFNTKIEWHKPEFNIHWMTPLVVGDYIYGIAVRLKEEQGCFVPK